MSMPRSSRIFSPSGARAVGALGDELHVERLRLLLADLVLEGARREDVRLDLEELLAA
jgi:hypothetical protein